MKKLLLLVALCAWPTTALAQRVANDLISYTPPPASWKKEVKERTYTSYSVLEGRKYCQIFVLLGMNTKGSVAADFEHDWQHSIVSSYKVSQVQKVSESDLGDGWQAKAGVGSFDYAGGVSLAMLTTISGHGRTGSIVAVTNSEDYTPVIQALLGSVQMNKVPAAAKPAVAAAPVAAPGAAKPTALQGYMEYNPFTKSWTWKVRYPPQ